MLSEERRTEDVTLGSCQRASRESGHQDEFGLETMDMNMGPQHPRTAFEAHTGARWGGAVRPRDGVPVPQQGEDLREPDGLAVVLITESKNDYMNNIAMEYGYCLAVEKLWTWR